MAKAPEETKVPEQQAKVHWNTQRLMSSYANLSNATSTREEVMLNFGVNQNWESTPAEIELEHRSKLPGCVSVVSFERMGAGRSFYSSVGGRGPSFA